MEQRFVPGRRRRRSSGIRGDREAGAEEGGGAKETLTIDVQDLGTAADVERDEHQRDGQEDQRLTRDREPPPEREGREMGVGNPESREQGGSAMDGRGRHIAEYRWQGCSWK